MQTTLWTALALMLVFEGLLPFLVPKAWRNVFRSLIEFSDGQLRFLGLTCMLVGLLILFMLRAD